MLNPEEVISHYKELKDRVSKTKDPVEKHIIVKRGLNKYSLNEWCEVGNILRNANLF